MITIEKNVAYPESNKNIVPDMEVGDSFIIPPELNFNSYRVKLYSSGGKKRYSIRKVSQGEYRVFRVA